MNRTPAVAAAILLAAAGSAPAGVDVAVGNGDKVSGTLNPSFESETFRATCPAGARLSVAVKGKRAKGAAQAPAAVFHVFDPDGAEIGAARIALGATGAALKNLPLAVTGEYGVVVSSSNGAVGDYQLKVSWKAAAKFTFQADVDATDATFDFSAAAGTIPAFSVKAARGSGAEPWVASVDGEDFSETFEPPPEGTTRSKVSGGALPATQDYTVTVSDQGGAGGGPILVTISLRPPRAGRRKLVLTDAVIGPGGAGAFAAGAVIDVLGGLVEAGETGASPIDGAAVSIPAGALSTATAIFVGTAQPIPPASGAGGAGPSVFFGPEGTQFTSNVTITIPFDPAAFPGGDFTSLAVFTRDAQGRITRVTAPLVIDRLAGTVSFLTDHFSSYRAFGPPRKSPADLDGDGVDELVVPAPGDSNGRGAVFVFLGRAGFAGGKTSDAGVVLTGGAAGDLFGAAVATGDVNGDGYADVVVGSSRANFGEGAVHVFFGNLTLASRSASAADVVLSAQAGDARFGATLAVADATGDGVADVLVGAPLSSVEAFTGGAVYLFRGRAGFASAAAGDFGVVQLDTQTDADHLGASIAVGDVNGDGKPDIVVGSDQFSAGGPGRVDVFDDGTTIQSQFAGDFSIQFAGLAPGDGFGYAVAVGDLNQDGTDDLAVGAPFEEDPAEPAKVDVGQVHVFFGGTGLAGGGADASDVTVRFAPADDGGSIGASLAIANVISNATPDLLYAIPGADRNSLADSGDLFLGRGGADFYAGAQIVSGDAAGELLGNLLAPADVDGDGFRDVVVAAPVVNAGAGRVSVLFGPGLFGRRADVTGAAGQALGARDDPRFGLPGKR